MLRGSRDEGMRDVFGDSMYRGCVMTAVEVQDIGSPALVLMEDVHVAGKRRVSSQTLLEAIAEDVEQGRPLILSILIKHVSYNKELSVAHLQAIIGILKKGVSEVLGEDPATAMTYVKAAELCVAEISLRSPRS